MKTGCVMVVEGSLSNQGPRVTKTAAAAATALTRGAHLLTAGHGVVSAVSSDTLARLAPVRSKAA